ncbi:unnamed protein product [Clonostachys chloroleuca]|uniref:Uncharacterized protein n=1 Tax=Clonostachys chloroleuca TaxID=1926264 RepID=A0AA35PYN2_9HYPO|nr:unnamed protein product [Clonostachys chloroleuca]
MDPPRPTGGFTDTDFFERAIKSCFPIIFARFASLFNSVRVGDCNGLGPVFDSLIGSPLDLTLTTRTLLIRFRQHRLVQLAEAFNHADDVAVLGVDLLDLFLVCAISSGEC